MRQNGVRVQVVIHWHLRAEVMFVLVTDKSLVLGTYYTLNEYLFIK